jgi:hypothetical protein
MTSFLRTMRRNPLDHTGDLPGVSPRLVPFLVALVVAVMALGVWANAHVVSERKATLSRALAADGLGPARITWIGWCKGAGPRYSWRTAAAAGTACVGPVNTITYGPKPRL